MQSEKNSRHIGNVIISNDDRGNMVANHHSFAMSISSPICGITTRDIGHFFKSSPGCISKAWLILLSLSHDVTRCSADLESSSHLNSDAAIRCHMRFTLLPMV